MGEKELVPYWHSTLGWPAKGRYNKFLQGRKAQFYIQTSQVHCACGTDDIRLMSQ